MGIYSFYSIELDFFGCFYGISIGIAYKFNEDYDFYRLFTCKFGYFMGIFNEF